MAPTFFCINIGEYIAIHQLLMASIYDLGKQASSVAIAAAALHGYVWPVRGVS